MKRKIDVTGKKSHKTQMRLIKMICPRCLLESGNKIDVSTGLCWDCSNDDLQQAQLDEEMLRGEG